MYYHYHLVLFFILLLLVNTSLSEERSGGGARPKVLILSFDNRDLTSQVDQEDVNYFSVTSVINKRFADAHGYDFLQVKTSLAGFVDRVKSKYNLQDSDTGGHASNNQPSTFNVGLKQFRAATWAKMPALWAVLVDYKVKYDYILFMDSDAALSPFHHNRSLTDAMTEWASDPKHIIRGNPNPYNAAFVFMSNHPWRIDMPCAGVFVVNTALAEPILREWWDYNLPIKNFVHFHEQDALWHMIDSADEYNFMMNRSMFTLVAERQFPSLWQPYKALWICHVASYNFMFRKPVFHAFLVNLSLSHAKRFEAAVASINTNFTFHIDMLDVAERMEKVSSAQPLLRKVKYPPHDMGTQQAWYDANVTSHSEPEVSPAILYEGELVSFMKGVEIFKVENGHRRSIPDWDTFQAMHFSPHNVFRLDAGHLNAIPVGNPLPKLDFSGRRKRIR